LSATVEESGDLTCDTSYLILPVFMAGRKKQVTITFQPGPEIMAALKALIERDGLTPSEAVRRALRAWLTEKGVMDNQPDRRRASTRRRP
jgi:hypothetical protein